MKNRRYKVVYLVLACLLGLGILRSVTETNRPAAFDPAVVLTGENADWKASLSLTDQAHLKVQLANEELEYPKRMTVRLLYDGKQIFSGSSANHTTESTGVQDAYETSWGPIATYGGFDEMLENEHGLEKLSIEVEYGSVVSSIDLKQEE